MQIAVSRYLVPGSPLLTVDTFSGHAGAMIYFRTTPVGVLEIVSKMVGVRSDGVMIKAYAPGTWIEAKVVE